VSWLACKSGMNLVLSYRRSRDEAEQTVADIEAARCHTTIVSGNVLSPADAFSSTRNPPIEVTSGRVGLMGDLHIFTHLLRLDRLKSFCGVSVVSIHSLLIAELTFGVDVTFR